MKNRSNTDTQSLCEFTLSIRIDPIAIDPIHFKISFDTIYVIIGKLSSHSSTGFEPSYYFGLLAYTVPQNQASKSLYLSFKPIRIESTYNQLSADTSFVIIGLLYHVHCGL